MYMNGFLGGLVNLISIKYLIRQKCKEDAERSWNDLHEVWINIKIYLFYFFNNNLTK